MTEDSRRLIAWFSERYPRGDDGSAEYLFDARRAQEMLLDAWNARRRGRVLDRRLGWCDLSRYPPPLQGKCYRGPKAKAS